MGSRLTESISLKNRPIPPNSRIRIRNAEWDSPTIGASANGGEHTKVWEVLVVCCEEDGIERVASLES
jgi:hypothetical protein